MTPLRSLKTFCVAAERLSFKDAADDLCLTASAVSHQIRDLELHLGVKLFERQTRAIALTHDGLSYYRDIEQHLRAIEQATRKLRTEPRRRPLVVQMPEFFASELFLPRVAEFSCRHPDIDLRIETTGPRTVPRDGADVDIVLTGRSPPFARVERLFAIRYVPACSTALHEQWSLQGFDALQHTTLLLHQARPEAWHLWAQLAGAPEPRPRQLIRVDSMFALTRAAEQGAGIALIPMPISGSWFKAGTLRRLFKQDLVTDDHYYVATDADGEHPKETEKLMQWVVDTFSCYGG